MCRLFVLAALLPLAAAAQSARPFDAPTPNPTVWPQCAAGQIQVMLVGTVHMANPGNDARNTDAPDVQTPERQAELDDLVARLAAFDPQKVMIEWVLGAESARADSAYAAYLAADGRAESREEIDQVAFRLARRLGHRAVYPIDFARGMDWSGVQAYARAGGEITHTMDYAALVPERLRVDEDALVRRLTMTEYHAWLNDDTALRGNHFGMFAGALGAGAGDAYPGPDMIAAWYGRNLNMVHHILRQVAPGDARVLVLVGAGHVRAMRHFLDEAPHFCPVSPLPLLAD
jgi:hypothetical protein